MRLVSAFVTLALLSIPACSHDTSRQDAVAVQGARPDPAAVKYVFAEDRPYYTGGCQQDRPADGTIAKGTKCALLRGGIGCQQIWTEDGSVRAWVQGGFDRIPE
jgi:hypothetical protein